MNGTLLLLLVKNLIINLKPYMKSFVSCVLLQSAENLRRRSIATAMKWLFGVHFPSKFRRSLDNNGTRLDSVPDMDSGMFAVSSRD